MMTLLPPTHAERSSATWRSRKDAEDEIAEEIVRSAIKTGSESYNEEEDSSVTSAGSSQYMSEISINKFVCLIHLWNCHV